MARPVIALIAGGATVLACGSEDPPRSLRYTEPPKANLLACSSLGDDPSLAVDEDGLLRTASTPAGCAVDGLSCPLEGVLVAAVACDTGEIPVARCAVEQWRLTCVDPGDPGDPPAGSAGYGGGGDETGQAHRGNGGEAGQFP